jgi:hypothetical protein
MNTTNATSTNLNAGYSLIFLVLIVNSVIIFYITAAKLLKMCETRMIRDYNLQILANLIQNHSDEKQKMAINGIHGFDFAAVLPSCPERYRKVAPSTRTLSSAFRKGR